VLAKRPGIYGCPSDSGAWDPKAANYATATTSYVAVVGPQTAWRGAKGMNRDDPEWQGRMGSTIMLVETANSGIPWTKPQDLNLTDLRAALPNEDSTVQPLHRRENGYFYEQTPVINVTLADGAALSLPTIHLTFARLQDLLVVGGCNETAITLLQEGARPALNWIHCIGLPTWIVSSGLLLFLAVRGRRMTKQRARCAAERETSTQDAAKDSCR
jgi:hypothetical protein